MQNNQDQVFEFQGKKYKFDTSGRDIQVGDVVRFTEDAEAVGASEGDIVQIQIKNKDKDDSAFDLLSSTGSNKGFFAYRVKLLQEIPEEVAEPKKYVHPLGEILVAIAEGRSVEYKDGGDWYPFRPDFHVVDFEFASPDNYRIAQPKPIELSHYLIYAKGSVRVTKKKYASEEDVQKGYNYKVKVIQRITEKD